LERKKEGKGEGIECFEEGGLQGLYYKISLILGTQKNYIFI